ncbi:hypothetical protein [Lentilactobacillus sp. Marseille-Q4993]|uniref:hypothetical protein n=1 Tax=Lentilactobacillus sp. Marseille-Q4993 TaxID=3039492 RepID=UPI0024BC4A95|nr:hypothetical protein [Lentilactobacillus sp. Marseille-Q4993]
MNKKILTISAMAATLTFGGVSATTVNAATWHKGTPKFFRGNWVQFNEKMPKSNQRDVYRFKSTKYKMSCSLNSNSWPLSHIKWRKAGNHYNITGKSSGRTVKFQIKKHGSKLQYKDSAQTMMLAKLK